MRILLWLCVVSVAAFADAETYYVARTGNDSAKGTMLHPWRTIQGAVNQLRSGDTVTVLPGNYPEHVNFTASGEANRPITVKAASRKSTMNPGSFFSRGFSHIRVEGFHIQSTAGDRSAIEFKGNASHIEIVNNEVSGMTSTAAAIRVGGATRHFSIDGNHVHHNNTGNQEAIRVHERTSHFAVTNNEVNDNTNIGIDIVGWNRYGKPTNGLVSHNFTHNNSTIAPWAANIYLDGPRNITVEYNIATGSEYGFQLGCEPSDDESSGNVLRYNLAYNNTKYGLGIGGYTGGQVHHCQIYNNTFVNNGIAIGFNRYAGHDNSVVNNILYEPRGQSINFLGQPNNTTIDFNCYFARFGDEPGNNSVSGDPQFKSVQNSIFRLTLGSRCIDAGRILKTDSQDFGNPQVPNDGDGDGIPLPDIGAFEYIPVLRK